MTDHPAHNYALSLGFAANEPPRDEAAERADRLVAAHILREFHDEYDGVGEGPQADYWLRNSPAEVHLAACPTVRVTDPDARGGNCGTGCETLRLSATIRCDCGQSADYDWGDFGNLGMFIAKLIKEDGRD